jgi:ribulose-phosphate 3-epimerase
MRIIPSVLEKNWQEAERKIRMIKELVTWIQIDVVDGEFSFGKTFELELVKSIFEESENNLLDIHLMVKEPIKWINKCDFAGASRIIGQVEMMSDREEFVRIVKDLGMEAGLAFDVETEVNNIPKETDVVLLMGRKTGFGVMPLEEKVWKKIKKIKEEKFEIGVDGGVTASNIRKIKEAGVDLVYCGGAVFGGGKIEDNLTKLQI